MSQQGTAIDAPIREGSQSLEQGELTAGQSQALRTATDLLARYPTRPVRIYGYAGTGKTTIAKMIPVQLGVPATYAAYTGKAAYVMRQKGCDGARTLHSLLYTVEANPRREVLQTLLLETEGAAEKQAIQRELEQYPLRWVKRSEPLVSPGDLLVIDEVSMVNEQMGQEILALGARLVVLGDPAQLPPVEGAGFFMGGDRPTGCVPDVMLTEIVRSDKGSAPYILGQAVRESRDNQLGLSSYMVDRGEMTVEDLSAYDMVLCGRNQNRWSLTHAMREYRFGQSRSGGRAGPGAEPVRGQSRSGAPKMPQAGEPVMFLRNSRALGVFNGQIATVVASAAGRDDTYILTVQGDGNVFTVTAPRGGFVSQDGQDAAKYRKGVVPATFAYVVTAHKAQGSEWGNVLVLADPVGRSLADQRRWMYTAVTRASESVTVVAV